MLSNSLLVNCLYLLYPCQRFSQFGFIYATYPHQVLDITDNGQCFKNIDSRERYKLFSILFDRATWPLGRKKWAEHSTLCLRKFLFLLYVIRFCASHLFQHACAVVTYNRDGHHSHRPSPPEGALPCLLRCLAQKEKCRWISGFPLELGYTILELVPANPTWTSW